MKAISPNRMASTPRSASAHQFRTSTMFMVAPPSRRPLRCNSIRAAGERVDAGVAAVGLVHLDAVPGGAGDPVMERPAPAAHGALRPRLAEGRRAVERRAERSPLGEARVDQLHDLAAHEVAAAPALVEDRRVVEERLDEEQLAP